MRIHLPSLRRFLPLVAGILLAPVTSLAAQSTRTIGLDTSSFDRSVRPQDDIFQFVNGGWIRRNSIPADQSSWGTFAELDERSRDAMHALLEQAARSSAPAGSEERKVGDFYASFMDSARVESLGLAPIQDEIYRIIAVRDVSQLAAAFAHLARLGVVRPIGVAVDQDEKHSSQYIVLVAQYGLGLPDRDYYLRPDARLATVREKYKEYAARLLSLAGQPDGAGAAERVLALETAMASRFWERARTRDREATYNRMTVEQLAALSPHFDWPAYLRIAGLGRAKEVIVSEPDYVTALDSLIQVTPIATWREYMLVRLLDSYSNELPSGFVQARFEFRGKVLSGQPEMRARWKRGVNAVEQSLGDAAGKLYVARYFKPEAKARADSLIHNMLEAFRVGIDSLQWMTPATKTQAKAKLARFTVKIGYPVTWRDYSHVRVDRDSLLANTMHARYWLYQEMADKLGNPVDRTRWLMTPQTVNAYYNSVNNEIVFPAAILQPPFFDPTADDAVNYGAIGAVIGHEIGHGFDDQGRKMDGEGNMRDWWTPADAKSFEERAAKLGAQYEVGFPVEGTHVNAKLTMGENIGDLSGLTQAYRAYHISLHGRPAPVIGGLTGDQRFFMSFATAWRTIYRDEALRQQLLSDPHSPGAYRAKVPLMNSADFQRAFGVRPGDRMYLAPGDRVRIW